MPVGTSREGGGNTVALALALGGDLLVLPGSLVCFFYLLRAGFAVVDDRHIVLTGFLACGHISSLRANLELCHSRDTAKTRCGLLSGRFRYPRCRGRRQLARPGSKHLAPTHHRTKGHEELQVRDLSRCCLSSHDAGAVPPTFGWRLPEIVGGALDGASSRRRFRSRAGWPGSYLYKRGDDTEQAVARLREYELPLRARGRQIQGLGLTLAVGATPASTGTTRG
jgi:hypothetical protein